MAFTPLVSVVIPTRNRPDLVTRAAQTALNQSVRDVEVVVVVDGPDPQTCRALTAIGDSRVRVVELPASGGAPNARNTGVRAARAQWTALLDDDDEWLPNKLAVQLEHAAAASAPLPIVGSRLINRTPRADVILPRRLPAQGEPLSEYLTVRKGLFHGDGFIQTSTIMAPTELLRRTPFNTGLRRLQELDWTLRAASHDDVELVMVAEPLTIWHADENRDRISFDLPWEQQLEWLEANRALFTPRAYAAILMSVISSMAAPTRSAAVGRRLIRQARRQGQPSIIDYVTFAQIWMLPPALRRSLRDRILGGRRTRRPVAAPQAVAAEAVVSPAPTPVSPAPPAVSPVSLVPPPVSLAPPPAPQATVSLPATSAPLAGAERTPSSS